MSTKPELSLIKSDYKEDSKAVLESAIEQDFDSVIVLGYKNGTVACQYSKIESITRVIGALEYAKHRLLISI